MNKTLPFTKKQIEEIIKKYPTPFHIYNEKSIRENVKRFYKAFDWVKDFKNYFAVKACPNPYIMKILKQEGMEADCSSLGLSSIRRIRRSGPSLVAAKRTGSGLYRVAISTFFPMHSPKLTLINSGFI